MRTSAQEDEVTFKAKGSALMTKIDEDQCRILLVVSRGSKFKIKEQLIGDLCNATCTSSVWNYSGPVSD